MTDAAMDNSPPPQATIEINLGKLQQLFNSLDLRFTTAISTTMPRNISLLGLRKSPGTVRSSWLFICRRSSWEAPIRLLWNVPYTITLLTSRSSHSAGCVLFSMMDVSPLL